jgi:anthranilate phosphoribosyltransferase
MLGPLVNPAHPTHQLTGVFDPELARHYQYLLDESDTDYAIVHSLDGYDEVSLTGPALVIRPDGREVLHPEAFHAPRLRAEDLEGGADPASAARIFRDVLEGKGTPAQRHAVAANAALAMRCFDPTRAVADCTKHARDILDAGQAARVLDKVIEHARDTASTPVRRA